MMYNTERKEQFLEEKRSRAIVANNLVNVFEMSEKKEESLGRDLCEWNSDEIIGFYKYYSTSSIQSLIMIHNALSEYANWCISNNLVSDNQNHFTEIDSEALCKCINTLSLKKLIITREMLLKELNALPNDSDKFIILGIFEGIPTKNNYLRDLKLSDINGNELVLPNGDERILSDELVSIAYKANEEEAYITMGKTNKEIPYIPDERIIKELDVSYSQNKNPNLLIGTRLRKAMNYLGYERMTINILKESGRINYIKEISTKENISFDEVVVKYRPYHERIYGKIQNSVTYLNVYKNM